MSSQQQSERTRIGTTRQLSGQLNSQQQIRSQSSDASSVFIRNEGQSSSGRVGQKKARILSNSTAGTPPTAITRSCVSSLFSSSISSPHAKQASSFKNYKNNRGGMRGKETKSK
mmetsp:Transcript_66060/g.73968  ORF Transcript_66060/g.73968 Transcript_66060/m.73968 type:complete len:114 (-) Transcript_66060:39-380(-)